MSTLHLQRKSARNSISIISLWTWETGMMLEIVSLRMMLPLRANHRCMFEAIILFSGMFIVNHRCESSGQNVSHKHENLLFIAESGFSSDASPQGVKHCFKKGEGSFDCEVEISREKDDTHLNLKKDTLSNQDIVVLPEAVSTSCIETAAISTGFLHHVDECFNDSEVKRVGNIRLTEGQLADLCGEFPEQGFQVTIGQDKNRCVFPPETSITISANSSETISSEQAATLINNVSSFEKLMGTSSTATLTVGNVTGILAKLSSKNLTKISFGRGSLGDLSIVQGNQTLGTDFSQTIEIPEETSVMALASNSSLAAVLFFPGMDAPSITFLNDLVIGIEMGARIANLSEPISIHFNGVQKNGYSLSCRSWDGGEGAPVWVTDGCETQETNSSVTCLCSHLTFFAILMSPAPAPSELSASDLKSLTTITSIGCGLSLFFQVVALCMHCLIRKRKTSLEIEILIQLFIAMFTMNLSFLVNETIAGLGIVAACVTAAAVLHYSLLATFTWFFMLAFHLYCNLWRIHSKIKHYMVKICIAGWVTPSGAVSVLLILHKYELLRIYTREGTHVNMCWIADAAVHQGVNIGYYSVVFIFTFSIFVVMVRQISLLKSAAGPDHDKSLAKTKAFSVLSLFLLLGLTWAFAFFSHGPLMLPFYYIFTILNTFQGFFLFIYYYKSTNISGGDAKPSSSSSSSSSSTSMAQTDVTVIDNIYANQSAVTSMTSK